MVVARHGAARPEARAPEYPSWESARSRCRNPHNRDYANYGGRGIQFDPAWDRFEDFMKDMGPRPRQTTLDRIDVDGDYAPGNCRWATSRVQGRNKRSNRKVVYRGALMTMVELTEATGVAYQLLHDRIVRRGWAVDRAVQQAVRRW